MIETKWLPVWMLPQTAFCAALLAPAGCAGLGDDVDGFSSEDWKRATALEHLATPTPRSPYNLRDKDVDVAKLGQMLFFDYVMADPLNVDSSLGKKGEPGK